MSNNVPVQRKARKIVLPRFVLTEVCNETDEGAVRVALRLGGAETVYFERPKLGDTGVRVDGKPKWKKSQFNLSPIVLDANGHPWPEANIYIVSRLQNVLALNMSTYDGIADDLVAYRRFLDDESIDWRVFPMQKLSRPTYRYSSHLESAVEAGELAPSTAKRRIASVIAYYDWTIDDGMLVPAYEPWLEKDMFLKLTGRDGFKFSRKVKKRDIAINAPPQHDPYDGKIDDDGKLRPLSIDEQKWIAEALLKQGNTEMTLIHLLSLTTGARIQTVLTFQVRHIHALVALNTPGGPATEIRCPVGPRTGIDTKRNKKMSLHIPRWVLQMLSTYVDSERARHRRTLASGGDTEKQYLFLSKLGRPFYKSKEDSNNFDATNKLRYPIKGGSVRTFMSEVIIPYIRTKYDANFRYQFHDLRASFGMNLTDRKLELVNDNKLTLNKVREFVKIRMGHDSANTTDRYLQFRANQALVLQIADDHDDYLRNLADGAGLL